MEAVNLMSVKVIKERFLYGVHFRYWSMMGKIKRTITFFIIAALMISAGYSAKSVNAESYKTSIRKLVKKMDSGEYSILSGIKGSENAKVIKLTKNRMARFSALSLPASGRILISDEGEYSYYSFDWDKMKKAGKNIFGKTVKVGDVTAETSDRLLDCIKTKEGAVICEFNYETEVDYTVRDVSIKKNGKIYQVIKKIYYGYWGANDGKNVTHSVIYNVKKERNSSYGYVITGMKIKPLTQMKSLPLTQAAINDSLIENTAVIAKVKDIKESNVLKIYRSDYDGDGKKEEFKVLGTDEEGPHQIYFESESYKGTLFGNKSDEMWAAYYENADAICKINSKQKLFVMEFGAFGSGSFSKCYYIENGKPYSVDQSLEGLTHLKGKSFAVHPSAFDLFSDGSGHTWKRYYVTWTGKNFKYVKSQYISQKKFKRYSGAKSILKRIKKEGYTVGSIIKRDNHIININLKKKYENLYENQNLTVALRGDKVKLKVVDKGNNGGFISKYSYGGIYDLYPK